MQIASMVSSSSAANKQAKALNKEAGLKAVERARETTAMAANQRVSFLNSGIALMGGKDTPSSVLADTYTKGKEDISQIKENYSTQINNVYSQARTKFLQGLGSLALMGAGSGLFSGSEKAVGGGLTGSLGESGDLYEKTFNGVGDNFGLNEGFSLGGV